MLRLLFCSAALLPIALVPWFTGEADLSDIPVAAASATSAELDGTLSYAERVEEPSIEALADCENKTLPVFFHDGYVTTHSAEFIHEGLDAATDGCDVVEATIVPVLPEYAESDDFAASLIQTTELRELVRQEGVDVRIAAEPITTETDALFINGRAAILRIEAKSAVAGATAEQSAAR